MVSLNQCVADLPVSLSQYADDLLALVTSKLLVNMHAKHHLK
jgi:hypothetical protein